MKIGKKLLVDPKQTVATNHSVFLKWPQVKLLELKGGFLHHEMGPRSQKRPELAKKAQNPSKIPCSALSGDPTDVTSATSHSVFLRWP